MITAFRLRLFSPRKSLRRLTFISRYSRPDEARYRCRFAAEGMNRKRSNVRRRPKFQGPVLCFIHGGAHAALWWAEVHQRRLLGSG